MDRRGFMGTATLLAAPQVLFAQAATERRFVFIIQRGAADGLNIVIPYAEPAYASLRGGLAIDPAAALKLDGTFALHPALPKLRELYAGGEATFVHAVASSYRDRSHFDAQNVLETGGKSPYQLKDGWMNRLLGMLPRSRKEAIAFAPAVPLAMRGAVPVTTYAPSTLPEANEDLLDAGRSALCARPAAACSVDLGPQSARHGGRQKRRWRKPTGCRRARPHRGGLPGAR